METDSPAAVIAEPLASSRREFWRAALWLFLLWLVIVGIRFCGPYNLIDQDQERPAAYIMDVLKHNEWIVQRDVTGDVSSKPPVYTWLGALSSLPFGRVNRFSLYLPCMLSVLGCALLILWRAGRYLGRRVAFWGAAAFIVSLTSVKMVCLARTDPVFMLMVFATGLTAFECWCNKFDWSNFWCLAAFATLTKGPLGVLLASMGLLAIVWERLNKRPKVGGSWGIGGHIAGIVMFLIIAGGWLWWAYTELGPPVINKMIKAELERHIVVGDAGEKPFENFFNPFFYFVTRFIPWSLFTIVGTIMACVAPAPDDKARRFERFCIVALFGSVIMFGFAGHKRPDHLFPLLPFAAIIAGKPLAWLAAHKSSLRYIPALLLLVVGGYAAVYYIVIERKEPKLETMAKIKDLALKVRDQHTAPLVYVTDPDYGAPQYTFQYFMNDMTYEAETTRVAHLLAGKAAVVAVVRNPQVMVPRLRAFADAGTSAPVVNVWAETLFIRDPDDKCEEDGLAVISNTGALPAATDHVAFTLWDLDCMTSNAAITASGRRHYVKIDTIDKSKPYMVQLKNTSNGPRTLHVNAFGRREQVDLMPGEMWSKRGAENHKNKTE